MLPACAFTLPGQYTCIHPEYSIVWWFCLGSQRQFAGCQKRRPHLAHLWYGLQIGEWWCPWEGGLGYSLDRLCKHSSSQTVSLARFLTQWSCVTHTTLDMALINGKPLAENMPENPFRIAGHVLTPMWGLADNVICHHQDPPLCLTTQDWAPNIQHVQTCCPLPNTTSDKTAKTDHSSAILCI